MVPPTYHPGAKLIHRLLPRRSGLADSLAGQLHAATRWLEWASLNRTNHPLVWVHAASVGESLSASPVVSRLRTACPGLHILHSYTSASTARWGPVFQSDRSDFLPLTSQNAILQVLELVRPSMIVYSRGDIWPKFFGAAASLGVPQVVIAGSVGPSSRRLWLPVRKMLSRYNKQIRWLGAVSEGDAERWARLGVPDHTIHITGDTRHDQVLERISDMSRMGELVEWARSWEVLVAGSTDAKDERVLLHAFSLVKAADPNAALLIVPHDPSEERVSHVEAVAARAGLEVDVWEGGVVRDGTQCVVVRPLGLLADLFSIGAMAYVGGGFRSNGLHTVLEPAAFGLPVIVGPEWHDSRDAGILLQSGGGISLPRRAPEKELASVWNDWISNDDKRTAVGLRSRAWLHQGAARKTTAELLRIIS